MTQTASIAVLRRAFVGRLLALEQLRVCEIERHHEDENRDGEDKRVHRVVMVENDQPDDGGDAEPLISWETNTSMIRFQVLTKSSTERMPPRTNSTPDRNSCMSLEIKLGSVSRLSRLAGFAALSSMSSSFAVTPQVNRVVGGRSASSGRSGMGAYPWRFMYSKPTINPR